MSHIKHWYEEQDQLDEPIDAECLPQRIGTGPVIELNSERYLDPTPLPGEEFRPIVGYEDAYEVSNLGRVRSLEREVPDNTGMRIVRERILRSVAVLSRNGSQRERTIASLMREAFLEQGSQ